MKYNVTKRFKTDSGKICNVGDEIEIKDEKEASRYMRMMECITPVEAPSATTSITANKADNIVGTSDEKPTRKK